MSQDLLKRTLEAVAGLSSTAKLVALCEAFGIDAKDDLECLLEAKPSTLREAKRALKIQRQKSSGAENPAPEIQQNAGNPAEAPEIQRQKSSVSSCAHATKELPSEVVIPRLDSPPSAPLKPKTSSPRGARLSADWNLPDDWRQWTRVHFAHASDAMVTLEAEKFRDFWISKSGQAAAKLDWSATWRNWCRTAFAAKPSNQPMNWGRSSWEEQKAAKHEATRKMLRDLGYTSEAVQ